MESLKERRFAIAVFAASIFLLSDCFQRFLKNVINITWGGAPGCD
jgi:hypothetical protein